MPTRFYFPSTGVPDISPEVEPSVNQWGVQPFDRRNLVTTRINSAMAGGPQIDPTSPNKYMIRQYVSESLASQTISGTFSCQIYVKGDTDLYNWQTVTIVRSDGTWRATLSNDGGDTTFVAATYTNKTYAAARALTSVAAFAGDRLVVECGVWEPGGSVALGEFMKFGDDGGTDAPVNNTDTDTTKNSWIEFSGTITPGTYVPPSDGGGSGGGTGGMVMPIVGERKRPEMTG